MSTRAVRGSSTTPEDTSLTHTPTKLHPTTPQPPTSQTLTSTAGPSPSTGAEQGGPSLTRPLHRSAPQSALYRQPWDPCCALALHCFLSTIVF